MSHRYLLKPMRGGVEPVGDLGPRADTWHEGAYCNAIYAAGVPTWKKRRDASVRSWPAQRRTKEERWTSTHPTAA